MDLEDIDTLEKDPYGYFSKDDPFWTDGLPEAAFDLMGIQGTSEIAQFEIESLHSNNLYSGLIQQDISHQGATKPTHGQSTSWTHPQIPNNPPTFPQQLTAVHQATDNTGFDPYQFLVACPVEDTKDQGNVSVEPSKPIYPGATVFANQVPYQDQRFTFSAPGSPEELGSYRPLLLDVGNVKANRSPVVVKEEQHSPKDTVNGQIPMNTPVLPGNEKFRTEPGNTSIPQGTRLNGHDGVDVNMLLDLIAVNSKAENSQGKKVNAPPNAIAPSALINTNYAHQVLQQLAQNQTNKTPNMSTGDRQSTLQGLLQGNNVTKKENKVPPKMVEKVGQKRPHKAVSSTEDAGQRQRQSVAKVKSDIKEEKKQVHQPPADVNTRVEKEADAPQQVPQVIITPQIVYSNGTTMATIPVTVTGATTVQASPVVPTTTLPIIINPKSDKVPIKRFRPNNAQEQESKPKTGGRTNHNAVEKRYREKINKSLGELSALVMGEGAKSTKSSVLDRAIRKINELKRINKRLQTENTKLRMSLRNLTLQDIIAMTYNNPPEGKEETRVRKGSYSSGGSMSDDAVDAERDPPSFDEADTNDDGELSPGSSSGGESLDSAGSFGLQDRTKMGLSIFLFAFMLFSPLSFLFPNKGAVSSGSHHFGSRMLLSTDSASDLYPSWQNYSSMFIQLMLGFFVFLWILLKGEPRIPQHSKQRKYCNRLVAEAKALVSQRKFAPANVRLEECLLLMGRRSPFSAIDLLFGFVWNITFFVIIQLGIMNVFKAVGWRILPGRRSSAQNKEEVEFSCSVAADAYWLLHEMAWMDPANRTGRMRRTFLWLKAINMAEMAGTQCSQQLYIRIYANAALDVGFTWPLVGMQIMKYFISQAFRRHRLAPMDTPSNVSFIFQPLTYEYLSSNTLCVKAGKWDVGTKKDSSLTEAVAKQFYLHQVKSILRCLVLKSSDSNENVFERAKFEISVLNQCFSSSSSKTSQSSSSRAFQALTSWWQPILYYLHRVQHLSEASLAEGLQKLEALNDGRHLGVRTSVAASLHSSLMATLELNQPSALPDSLEAKMGHVERNIEDLRSESEGIGNGGEEFSELEKLCIIAACELLLKARFQTWENNDVDVVSEAELNQAEMSLDFLQYFNYPELKSKVKSYSMILRYLSGCNPVDIIRDLQHNPWYTGFSKEQGSPKSTFSKYNEDVHLFVSSGAAILRSGLTPNERIRSRMKAIEKLADGRENSSLRRTCRNALSHTSVRGS